jgi:hypothetical protein
MDKNVNENKIDEFLFNENQQETFFLRKNEQKKQGGKNLCWFNLNNSTLKMLKSYFIFP